MKLWKRNAIAAAIVLFVCGAVYLNWSYSQDTAAGKNLGEAALVGSQNDPLLEKQKEGAAAEEGAAGEEGAKTEEGAAAQEGADAESGTYFSTARLNRQQARDNALSLLQEAAEDEKADQSSVDQANAAIQTMADYTMTAVTPVPSRKPLSGVPVRRYKTTSSLLPATFFNPSPISAMPNRNSATPLSSEITLLMLISKFLHTIGGILSIMAQNS